MYAEVVLKQRLAGIQWRTQQKRRSTNIRRWPNIPSTLGERLVFAGKRVQLLCNGKM